MDTTSPAAGSHAFDLGSGTWGPSTIRWRRWDVWTALDDETAQCAPLLFVLWLDDVPVAGTGLVSAFEAWPIAVVLRNWSLRLSELCRRCALAERRSDGDAAGLAEVAAWVAHTRALAARVTFGDAIPRHMCAGVDEVERLVTWPSTRFDTVPGNGRDMSRLMLNTDLWAVDTLRKRLKDLLITLPLDGLLTGLLMPIVNDFPDLVPDLAALKQRAWRLSQHILPGQADDLMADVLTTLRGPFLPDGSREASNTSTPA